MLSENPVFGTILKKVAAISRDKCLKFPAGSVKSFTEAAMKFLVSIMQLF
jgi:hypothetical protein